jgi:Pectate lyase superfamily protein
MDMAPTYPRGFGSQRGRVYSGKVLDWRRLMAESSRRRWLATVPAAAVPLLAQDPVGITGGSGARIYNVRDHGAQGDGRAIDTAAVQAAIDACARDRGGVVLIPAGDFVVGTVELKSNVTLRVAAAGRLVGSGKADDFSAGKGVPPGNGNVVSSTR